MSGLSAILFFTLSGSVLNNLGWLPINIATKLTLWAWTRHSFVPHSSFI